MNATEWDAEKHRPQYMADRLGELGAARSKGGRRKLRLFAIECCRYVWEEIPDDRLKRAIEAAERLADERADVATVTRLYESVHFLQADGTYPNASARSETAANLAISACHPSAYNAAFCMTAYQWTSKAIRTESSRDKLLCDLMRCVFGNPFRKPAFPKAWRTETVTALATGIYAGRAFDRLPILADALEEAGCDDPAMLNHLRGPGLHCRGCWVLDLALGK